MRSTGSGPDPYSALDRICETAARLTGARRATLGVLDEEGHGLDALVTYGPPDDGANSTVLDVPVRVEDEVCGSLRLTEKDGGATFTDADRHLVRVLATEAGMAVANARLYETARRRERWIDGSVAVTTALLSGGDADEALSVVAEQARRLADAAAGIVLLPATTGPGAAGAGAVPAGTSAGAQPTGAGAAVAGAAGRSGHVHGLEVVAVSPAGPPLGLVVPRENPIVERLLAGEAVFVADAASDPRTASPLSEPYGPAMLLPLESGGRVLGALVTPRVRGACPFEPAERALAARFAAQAALALVMAEAQRDRERLAVYEDRDRIARDLHDLVIQRLFATGMMLERAQRGSIVPAVREGVGRAVNELDVTIQEIRTAIFALRQSSADAPSELSIRVLREIGMAAVPLGFTPAHRFVGPIDTAVGEQTGRNLIAALREALSNAFRHAHAHRIEVVVDATATLTDDAGTTAVRLTVADDGVGIPEGGRRSGLRNLARRAESLGGSSRCGPGIGADGGGTTVMWEAPL
ncbi:GAF domain-containing sensor histidine kinase [Streptomyces sp. NPDC047928]|uniref:GAF domain-containing sensor histidine kinase n=1 Tax=unclassified Streptomyces TaxID=2593676 RepID=UPI003721E418